MNKKIAFIAFYFGEFNNYFDLWLKSVGVNSDYNFILFTDDSKKYDFPQNVELHYLSFEKLKSIIQQNFDFKVSIPYSYKICDFRPAFGEIFHEYLAGYDYWGTIDLDIILGNLNNFINDDLLDKYDRIFTQDHLLLYRNTPAVNSAYKGDSNYMTEYYRTVFTSSKLYGFGEKSVGGTYYIWRDNAWSMFEDSYCADLYFRINHFSIVGDKVEGIKKQLFLYSEGKLIRFGKINNRLVKNEFMYIHLQKRKIDYYFGSIRNESFIIVPNKIIKISDCINDENFYELIDKYIDWRVSLKDYTMKIPYYWSRLMIRIKRKLYHQ